MTQAFLIVEVDDNDSCTNLVSGCVMYDAYISHTGRYLNMYYNTHDMALTLARRGTFSNFESKGLVNQRDGEDECIYGTSINEVCNDYYDYLYYYSLKTDCWMVQLPNDEDVWYDLGLLLESKQAEC